MPQFSELVHAFLEFVFYQRSFRMRRITRLLISFIIFITTFTVFMPFNRIAVFAQGEEISFDGGLRGEHIAAHVRVGTPPSSNDDCVWEKVNWTDPTREHHPLVTNFPPPEDAGYKAYVKSCTQPEQSHSLHWIHNSVFNKLGDTAEDAIDRLIPKPGINFAPARDRNVVNVGSWFWIDRSMWKSVSVTAYVPTQAGTFSVTTTAKPKRLIFVPGDGDKGTGEVSCDGPGRKWQAGYGDNFKSACMYTYRHASHNQPKGIYNAKFSVEWDISMKFGIGGSRVGISKRITSTRISTIVPIRVNEIQAVAR